MNSRQETAVLIRQGISPIQIAEERSRTVNTVTQHVLLQLGEGALRAADVFFSIPADRRAAYQHVYDRPPKREAASEYVSYERCRELNLSHDEFIVYEIASNGLYGDMYAHLGELEVSLHQLVRKALETAFPQHDDDWWREGVPLSTRQRCVSTREADPDHISDPYAYTNFIDLKAIIEANWRFFKDVLPKAFENEKKPLMQRFTTLNKLRNRVMHPIKRAEITKDDFDFIRETRAALHKDEWRI